MSIELVVATFPDMRCPRALALIVVLHQVLLAWSVAAAPSSDLFKGDVLAVYTVLYLLIADLQLI